ncbi:MAG: hypothetical protein AAGH79_02545 [Bacteroidota bacterium]
MKKRPITLLDLGGVVFQSTGQSNATIDWAIITALNHQYGHALNIGEDRFPDFLQDYNQQTQQVLSGPEFLRAVFDTLAINQPLIDWLRQRSEIIIVSDNYRENIAYISERYKFHEWASQQIYSFDYRMVKADARFFAQLIEDLPDYSIEEMIFIDDSIHKIESAAQHGIRGILYQSNEQLFRDYEAGHFHL